MITVLADHNIEGQATLLWSTLATSGWLDLDLLHLTTFADAGVPFAIPTALCGASPKHMACFY